MVLKALKWNLWMSSGDSRSRQPRSNTSYEIKKIQCERQEIRYEMKPPKAPSYTSRNSFLFRPLNSHPIKQAPLFQYVHKSKKLWWKWKIVIGLDQARPRISRFFIVRRCAPWFQSIVDPRSYELHFLTFTPQCPRYRPPWTVKFKKPALNFVTWKKKSIQKNCHMVVTPAI